MHTVKHIGGTRLRNLVLGNGEMEPTLMTLEEIKIKFSVLPADIVTKGDLPFVVSSTQGVVYADVSFVAYALEHGLDIRTYMVLDMFTDMMANTDFPDEHLKEGLLDRFILFFNQQKNLDSFYDTLPAMYKLNAEIAIGCLLTRTRPQLKGQILETLTAIEKTTLVSKIPEVEIVGLDRLDTLGKQGLSKRFTDKLPALKYFLDPSATDRELTKALLYVYNTSLTEVAERIENLLDTLEELKEEYPFAFHEVIADNSGIPITSDTIVRYDHNPTYQLLADEGVVLRATGVSRKATLRLMPPDLVVTPHYQKMLNELTGDDYFIALHLKFLLHDVEQHLIDSIGIEVVRGGDITEKLRDIMHDKGIGIEDIAGFKYFTYRENQPLNTLLLFLSMYNESFRYEGIDSLGVIRNITEGEDISDYIDSGRSLYVDIIKEHSAPLPSRFTPSTIALYVKQYHLDMWGNTKNEPLERMFSF